MTAAQGYNLVADIGGTNTRVGLAQGKAILSGSIQRFRNAGFDGLEAILGAYVTAQGVPLSGACVAVAGPVANDVARMTNLDWTIGRDTLAGPTGAKTVAILNDLQAQGHALGYITADKLFPVIGGLKTDPAAAKLVIGVGTGFNAAPVHETPWGRFVAASECGHVNFPVRTEADLRLAQFVESAHGFPGVEDVLSGRGLERIFAFLASAAGTPTERGAARIMEELAAENGAGLATETAQFFAGILGAEAGNLALTHLPFGGVFLCGGVSRAFAPYLKQLGFEAAFQDKGRFSGFMKNFPVTVVEDDYAALTGCAAYLDSGAKG